MGAFSAASCAPIIPICTTSKGRGWVCISAGNWLNIMEGVSGSNRSRAKGLPSTYHFPCTGSHPVLPIRTDNKHCELYRNLHYRCENPETFSGCASCHIQEKHMPKRHQNRLAKIQAGGNNPKKSTVITTGTPRKKETVYKEAAEHKDTGKIPQEAKVPPELDLNEGRSHKADSQAMSEEGEKRSGSDSNAGSHRKGSRLHDSNKAEEQPPPHPRTVDEFADDLNPDNLAGENHGQGLSLEAGLSAYDVKELHDKLADLTDDELKNVPIVPVGSRLEQGAKH